MDILVILAHPKQGSFNHAIAETIVDTLKIRDIELFSMIFTWKNSMPSSPTMKFHGTQNSILR